MGSIIGITGTHGTGKTTLLNALIRQDRFRGFTICDEVTRWVAGIGFDINESGNDVTQELIMMRHIHNLWSYDNMITDRTMLDCYVYSKYLHLNDKISDYTMNIVERAFLRTLEQYSYDYLFIISPEFPLENDGVRSANVQFQKDIHSLFKQMIEIYDLENNANLMYISGSVEDRVNQILRYSR